MSQRTRVLRVIALTTLPLLVFAIFLLWRDQVDARARVERDRVALARTAALATHSFIEGHLSTVRALAVAPVITHQPPAADRSALLGRVLAENPDWQGLSVIDADGWNLSTASGTEPHTVNIADRPYFQQLMATGEPVVGSAVIGRLSGLPTVVLAAPIAFATGERGALIAPLPTERLAESLRTRVASEQVHVVLVDDDGQTFVDPDPARVAALMSLTGRADADAVLAGETGSRVLDVNGVETLAAYAPVPDLGWGVIVTEPAALAFAPAREGFRFALVVLALAVGAVAWMGWYFGGRLSRAYDGLLRSRQEADAARAEAEQEREHASFLAEISRELAESLDYTTTLDAVTRLCVPRLGDWCAVDVVSGTRMDRIAIAHADPAKAEAARELARLYPPLLDAGNGPGRAILTGRPAIVAGVSSDMLTGIARDEQHLRLLRTLGMQSALAVPLRARGHTVGALTIVSASAPEAYGPQQVRLAMDVAGRAALAVENARLYGELERALGTRDEFLASAAHDLRTPLTAIKGSVQLLQRQLATGKEDLPDRLHWGLGTINTTATRMAEMIDSLLDVALLQLGRALELERTPTDLVALARAVLAEEEPSSARHEITVEGDDAVVGEWDGSRLYRVIANLVDNAVKYSPSGATVRIAIYASEVDGSCEAVLTGATRASASRARISAASSSASGAAAMSWGASRGPASGSPARDKSSSSTAARSASRAPRARARR